MRFLLDTHVLLWMHTAPGRLAEQREMLDAPDAERFVSVASAWEIAIKYARGRLPLPEPPATYVPSRIAAIAARTVLVELAHATAVAELPPLHRDPFDRLLVAQAQALGATIVTADDAVAQYPVDVLRVGAR